MAWLPLSQAQVAPTAAETAAYRGLHAAAARGEIGSIVFTVNSPDALRLLAKELL